MKSTTFLLICLIWANIAAQNPHSLNPIPDYEVMYKNALWFRVDMRQKINAPFFANGHEFWRVIIDAVRTGKILPYKNDSLTERLDKEVFLKNIQMPLVQDEDEFIDNQWDEDEAEEPDEPVEYTPKQMYLFEMKEDIVFDKRRSRLYHDILAVTLVLPAELNPKGVEQDLGTFSYKELVEQVFRHNSDAVWYNHQNPAQHHNLEDAFTLRLFGGRLVKVQNSNNSRFDEIYRNPRKALIASEKALHKLIEFEALLWEY